MGPPGEGEGARQRDSGATSGGHRAAAASRGRWLRFACVSGLVVGQCLAQSADERACSYFGQGATGRADKIVKDRCPSSRHGGFYYFTVDVLPGSGCTKPPLGLLTPAGAITMISLASVKGVFKGNVQEDGRQLSALPTHPEML